MFPHAGKLRWLILPSALVLVGLPLASAQNRSGAPAAGRPPGAAPANPAPAAPAPAPKSTVVAFAADGSQWAWIEQRGTEASSERIAYRGGPDGKREEITRGPDLGSIAVRGSELWLTRGGAGKGTLLRAGQGGLEPVAEGLNRPYSLKPSGDALYWLEITPSAVAPLSFVPPLAGEYVLRRLVTGRQPETVASWPVVVSVEALRGESEADDADLIAVGSGEAYVRVRGGHSSEFYRIELPAAAGATARRIRLAAEEGVQHAVVSNGYLYWTAPSEEATVSAGLRCIKRVAVSAEGATTALTDWLPQFGSLLLLDGKPRYAADKLYEIPGNLGPARPLRSLVSYVRYGSDGVGVVALEGAAAPFRPGREED